MSEKKELVEKVEGKEKPVIKEGFGTKAKNCVQNNWKKALVIVGTAGAAFGGGYFFGYRNGKKTITEVIEDVKDTVEAVAENI